MADGKDKEERVENVDSASMAGGMASGGSEASWRELSESIKGWCAWIAGECQEDGRWSRHVANGTLERTSACRSGGRPLICIPTAVKGYSSPPGAVL